MTEAFHGKLDERDRKTDSGINVDRILGLYWGYMGIMEKKMEATI